MESFKHALKKHKILFLIITLLGAWYGPLGTSLLKPKLAQQSQTSSLIAQVETAQAENQKDELSYPALKLAAPLIISPQTDPMQQSNWNTLRQALRNGVGVSYREKEFNEAHSLYVIGHSSDLYPHAFAYVFAALGQAELNQAFSLRIDNKTYAYTVVDKKILHPTDIESFQELEKTDSAKQRALLVTCWPILTTKERLVVVGERSL